MARRVRSIVKALLNLSSAVIPLRKCTQSYETKPNTCLCDHPSLLFYLKNVNFTFLYYQISIILLSNSTYMYNTGS